jgi:beta-glucosidase
MNGRLNRIIFISFSIILINTLTMGQTNSYPKKDVYKPPVSFEEANQRAEKILKDFTLDQKIELLGGYSDFFIHGFPEHGVPCLYMSDATQGVRLSSKIKDTTIVKKLEKSTAFPAPVLLTATWNPQLAREYAHCIGEECRAGGVSVLLGPGLNIYRQAQAGRSFEYFGEDPFLISRMIENYIYGVQSTGTSATLKHFVCNNTDFYRRRSNSIVDERALNEIYLPGFKAGIDAGVTAVMTAYNKLNGEWCGQSDYVINNILRNQLGFKWLVMTDWTSVYDGEKVIKSGQNLEMPRLEALSDAWNLLKEGKVSEDQINRMAKSILRTCIAMGFYDRSQQDLNYLKKFAEHEQIALETARQGIVLLKNDKSLLPLAKNKNVRIVATGKYLNEMAHGGGSAYVEGYNNITLAEALKVEFADQVEMVEVTDEKRISAADVVILSTGTFDSEGYDRPFDLPEDELQTILRVLDLGIKTIIIVNSGAGINMSPWADKASAIIYAWYPGQKGNNALAEILSGKVNPSGKLPITIEKQFQDSPGYGYIPKGEELYDGWVGDNFTHKEYDIKYGEGIFVGYRWYEHKGIKPLFAFGHGLSYSKFEYSGLKITPITFTNNDQVKVTFTIKNVSSVDGAEIAQVYVQDMESSYTRPVKELKGFDKIFLKAGEKKEVNITLDSTSFSYWNPDQKQWYAEPGTFKILVGSASDNILLEQNVILE